MRINKFLSRAGVASRRRSEELILQGRVRIDGEVVTELATQVDPESQVIEVDEKRVRREKTRWIALHKPPGVITTRDDPGGRRTVYDLLPAELESLPYVGRLDMDTEGLLLLSNDGDVVHRMMHPRWEVERVYEVETAQPPPRAALDRLVAGVELEDGPAQAVRAESIRRPGAWIRLVLLEGRNREVRRMMEAVGHPVVRLRRVRYGPVALGGLDLSQWRELTEAEVRSIRFTVEMDAP